MTSRNPGKTANPAAVSSTSIPGVRPGFGSNLARRWRTPLRLRLAFVAACGAYIVVFYLAYTLAVAPTWAYMGFTHIPPPHVDLRMFAFIAVLPAFWMPIRLLRPSQWMYLYLYIAVYVPSCAVPLLRSGSSAGLGANLLAYSLGLCGCMAALGGIYYLPVWPVKPAPMDPRLFWTAIFGFLAIAYMVVYANYGSMLHFVFSLDVRDQRMAGREVLASASLPLVLGYAVLWSSYAINPLILAYGALRKKYWAIALGIAGQCYLYSCGGSRGTIAAVPLVFIVAFIARRHRNFAIRCIVYVTLCIAAASALVLRATTPVALGMSSVIMRVVCEPARVSHEYYDFFSTHEQTGFSHIRGLEWLQPNPYQGTPLGFVIGSELGSPQNNMNANLWADGFASEGFIGMALVTLVAAAAFHLLDSLSTGVECRLALLAICAHGMNLADLSINTTILGNGFLLTVFLLYVFPRSATNSQKDSVKVRRGFPGFRPSAHPSAVQTLQMLTCGRCAAQDPYALTTLGKNRKYRIDA